MRVLVISGWYPYPPDNGARIREFNLIKQLAARHEISLLAFYTSPPEMSQARLDAMRAHCCSVAAVPYQDFRPGGLRALAGLFSSRPRSVVDTYSREMADLVCRTAEETAFDVVLAATQRTAPYALLLKNIPCVFEEIELAVLYEMYAEATTPAARVRYGLMWWKQRRYLRGLLKAFDGWTVVSPGERDLVSRVAPENSLSAVVPNGVDLAVYGSGFGAPRPDTLIYPGALTFHANFDAMLYFLRDILPAVREQRPEVSLRITGSHEGVPLTQLPLGDGVELTGYLDDVRPAVAQSCVCVVPLRVGGGTRLKILEAMALGTPVVATLKGAEGLDVTPGEDILIADSPGDFAQAVCRLLEDEALRARLSVAGRRLVEARYSWEMCARNLEHLFQQAVERGSRYG